jgi:glycosyltransferase involved in cell wall biosynthesis
MHVALTHPYCWPEVHRGGERLFHDLARYLSGAGHQVTAISSAPCGASSAEPQEATADSDLTGAPGEPTDPSDGGGRVGSEGVLLSRALPTVQVAGLKLDRPVSYLPATAMHLRRARPDVVHGMFHLDGVAARMSSIATQRRPYVVHVQGMPRRANLERLRSHRLLFGPSMRGAAAVVAVSRAAADALSEELGVQARAIHNGVWNADFAHVRHDARSPEPTVLFPSDPDDERKRLDILIESLRALSSRWPGLVLTIAARPSTSKMQLLKERLGERVKVLGVAHPREMAAAYASSWVSCLPAVSEAFGLVIVESLAAGRPAVAVADGGVPEVLNVPSWLASPNDHYSLAAALDQALADSQSAASVDRCRRLAAPFDWSVRGPDFVALYEEVTRGDTGQQGGRRSRRRGRHAGSQSAGSQSAGGHAGGGQP